MSQPLTSATDKPSSPTKRKTEDEDHASPDKKACTSEHKDVQRSAIDKMLRQMGDIVKTEKPLLMQVLKNDRERDSMKNSDSLDDSESETDVQAFGNEEMEYTAFAKKRRERNERRSIRLKTLDIMRRQEVKLALASERRDNNRYGFPLFILTAPLVDVVMHFTHGRDERKALIDFFQQLNKLSGVVAAGRDERYLDSRTLLDLCGTKMYNDDAGFAGDLTIPENLWFGTWHFSEPFNTNDAFIGHIFSEANCDNEQSIRDVLSDEQWTAFRELANLICVCDHDKDTCHGPSKEPPAAVCQTASPASPSTKATPAAAAVAIASVSESSE